MKCIYVFHYFNETFYREECVMINIISFDLRVTVGKNLSGSHYVRLVCEQRMRCAVALCWPEEEWIVHFEFCTNFELF